MGRDEIVISDGAVDLPRRSLRLESIVTAELRPLAPIGSEMVLEERDRTAILLAYSDRLRESYRSNVNGFRDGMQMLAETVGNGQTLAISCSCRNGAFCHADVVRMAVEKIGQKLKEQEHAVTRQIEHREPQGPNVRTQRAIAEILGYSNNDRLLSRIDQTDGRSRPEHASYLNRISQFARDDFERGAISRNGIAIIPNELAEQTPPLAIATQEHAVERLTRILGNESRARELAPKIVEAGEKIAGSTADRETQLKVFQSMYDSLQGRRDFVGDQIDEAETKEERFERNLHSISRIADEMSKLEPTEELILLEDKPHAQTVTGYDRIDAREPEISKLISKLPTSERERWFNEKFPVIDRQLESGESRQKIIGRHKEIAYDTAKNDPGNRHDAVNDVRIAAAYVDHQMSHPDTRLRNQNDRYRKYAAMLEHAVSREDTMKAATAIRVENARAKDGALTAKEMQYLFAEISPAHYSTEMTAARLSYSHSGVSRTQITKALLRGESKPSPEAAKLIDSLEERLDRRNIKDAASGTRHFLESLRTPNGELRSKNAFDHSETYQLLPPQEKDFVYQRAIEQKERLEAKIESITATRDDLRKTVTRDLSSHFQLDRDADLTQRTKALLAKYADLTPERTETLSHAVASRISRAMQRETTPTHFPSRKSTHEIDHIR